MFINKESAQQQHQVVPGKLSMSTYSHVVGLSCIYLATISRTTEWRMRKRQEEATGGLAQPPPAQRQCVKYKCKTCQQPMSCMCIASYSVNW